VYIFANCSEETTASIFRVGKRKNRAAYFSNTCVHICQLFGRNYCFHLQGRKEEEQGSIFLQYACTYWPTVRGYISEDDIGFKGVEMERKFSSLFLPELKLILTRQTSV
jgi:hypothetical protein